jgi:hypothetical protein
MSQKVAFMSGGSALPVSANEKMLNSEKRFDRNFVLIRADMAARACMRRYVIGGEASGASALPG